VNTQTLPLDEGEDVAPGRVDHLYLALTADKPIGGALHRHAPALNRAERRGYRS
jgi:hypothetical protein